MKYQLNECYRRKQLKLLKALLLVAYDCRFEFILVAVEVVLSARNSCLIDSYF